MVWPQVTAVLLRRDRNLSLMRQNKVDRDFCLYFNGLIVQIVRPVLPLPDGCDRRSREYALAADRLRLLYAAIPADERADDNRPLNVKLLCNRRILGFHTTNQIAFHDGRYPPCGSRRRGARDNYGICIRPQAWTGPSGSNG